MWTTWRRWARYIFFSVRFFCLRKWGSVIMLRGSILWDLGNHIWDFLISQKRKDEKITSKTYNLRDHLLQKLVLFPQPFIQKDSLASQPCFLPSLLPSFFFLLRGRDRDRDRQNSHLLVHSLTFPQQLGVDLAQIGSWKFNSGLSS